MRSHHHVTSNCLLGMELWRNWLLQEQKHKRKWKIIIQNQKMIPLTLQYPSKPVKWLYSSIYLKSAYHEQKLHPNSTKYCGFKTGNASYELMRCPLGLVNAAALFAELIHIATHKHAVYLIAFLDDLLIYSSSVESHFKHLKGVLDSFREANLRLHVYKSHWACDSVQFLGHRLTAGTFSTDKDKLDAVSCFPTPACTKQVKSLLGLCSFWRSHIKNFSQKSNKLRALLQKEVKFYWNQEHEQEFQD
jgi:hypothetical protein